MDEFLFLSLKILKIVYNIEYWNRESMYRESQKRLILLTDFKIGPHSKIMQKTQLKGKVGLQDIELLGQMAEVVRAVGVRFKEISEKVRLVLCPLILAGPEDEPCSEEGPGQQIRQRKEPNAL